MVNKNSPPQPTDPFLAQEAEKYEKPTPSREFILSVLTSLQKPVKRRALTEYFALEDPDVIEGLRRRLKAMVRDGQLLKIPEGYVPITEMEIYQGVVAIERDGEGFLRYEGDKHIALSGPALRGHYDGDVVEVQIIQLDKEGNARGRIIKLIEGVAPLVIGRFMKGQDVYFVIPFDRKFTQNITIPKAKKGAAKNDDIVQVKILRDEEYKFHYEPVAEVIEVLGDISTPGIEIKMAIRKFGIPQEWPKAVLKESEKFNSTDVKLIGERTDMTESPFVTIDGEDAKDFDDAVLCEPRTEGGWRLWVAIADVSFYVKSGSALDKEAVLRGNSTYFPGSVIPMLPEVLSNGLCSLKPNVNRNALVCQMNISSEGEITRSIFYRALIHSQARLTYTEVAEILRGNETLKEKYSHVLHSLEALHNLYHALHQQRKERGAIDFETTETRILFDQSGKIKSIVPQVRNVAHKMIEESMLAANVSAAKFIQRHKRTTLFRIHDRPPTDKLKSLRTFLSELGLDLPGRTKPTAKDFSKLVESIQQREDKHLIETVLLRSLSQAQYSPKNIGHFGLAYPSYLHFTSPIRRYPDLIVHRVINEILTHKADQTHALQEADLEKIGTQCSESERRSDEATRDAVLALKCHYMQDKVGEAFRGVITGVANFGIFVELKDIYVEGLVHVTGLGNEYFNYDPASHRMIGERTRTSYQLGDSCEVRVMRVDVEAKRIDLELCNAVPKAAKGSKGSPGRSTDERKKSSQAKKRRRKSRR